MAGDAVAVSGVVGRAAWRGAASCIVAGAGQAASRGRPGVVTLERASLSGGPAGGRATWRSLGGRGLSG